MLLKPIFVKTIKNHAPAKTWTFAITHGNVGVKKIPEVNGELPMKAHYRMTKPKLALLAIALAGLTSCATPNQKAANAVRGGYVQGLSNYYRCLSTAGDQPVYLYLAQHFNPSDPSKDTQTQRENGAVASLIDTKLLMKYRAAIETCQKPQAQGIPGYTAFSVAQNQAFLLNEENLSVLIDRQESWGEYVYTRDLLAERLPASLNQWQSEVAAGQPLQMSEWQATVNQVQTALSEREGRVVAW
jgi:hypothetical protein